MRRRIQALITAAVTVAGLGLVATPAQAADRYNIEIDNADGYCLDIPGGNASPGVVVQSWTCNHSSAQQWNVVYADSRYIRIQSVANPEMCLNNQWGRDRAGDKILLYYCDNKDSYFNTVGVDWNGYWQFQPEAAYVNCVNFWGGSGQGNEARQYPCEDRKGNSLFDLWDVVRSEG